MPILLDPRLYPNDPSRSREAAAIAANNSNSNK